MLSDIFENSIFHQIVAIKGSNPRTEALHLFILLVGSDHLGEPNKILKGELFRIHDIERLLRMLSQASSCASWSELFQIE